MFRGLDLVGRKFGVLEVLSFSHVDETNLRCWVCKCVCDTIKTIKGTLLLRGRVKSCGCQMGGRPRNDLIGETFGNLQVVEFSHVNKNGNSCWICLCVCGNLTTVCGGNLKSGITSGCGCLQGHREDLTNQVFGMLTVQEFSHVNKQRLACWKCLCECGGIKIVSSNSLKTGHTTSCGCLSSKLEKEVQSILRDHNIFFEKEHIIPRDISENKKSYFRIDFFVEYDNTFMAIECQGIQHYKSFIHFGGEKRFQEQQWRDGVKRDILKSMNIPLIEVRYDEPDIEQFLLLQLREKCAMLSQIVYTNV